MSGCVASGRISEEACVSATVRPIWFGPEDRSLFGSLHLPDRPSGVGVALCPSIGLDGEASQFAFRVLAARLASEGCTVLRFDYDGTGDSVGCGEDPGRIDTWVASIGEALALLRDSGCSVIHLVGARLGVPLAIRAASADGSVASLSCWYPTSTGSQFLRYQRALRRLYAIDGSPEVDGDATEIPGYVLDAATTADLKTLVAWSPDLCVPDALLIVDTAPPATAPPEVAPAPTVFVSLRANGAEDLFGVELMKAAVDPADVNAIAEFIAARPRPEEPGQHRPVGRDSAVVATTEGATIVERPVALGDAGLFAMVTERVGNATGGGSLAGGPRYGHALFLNAGSLHHIGPGRQWVEMSRAWAADGVRSLRLDLGGVGESPLTGPPGVLSSYPPSAVADIDAGMEFLAPNARDDVVLLGLCSGAYHCLLGAPQVGAGAVALVNPLRLPVPHGKGSTLVAFQDDEEVVAPVESAPSKRFLGDMRDRGVFTPLVRRLPDQFWTVANRIKGSDDPAEVFRRVVDSGVEVFIVCGPEEWRTVGRGRHAELRRMAETGRFHLAMIPTLDHAFHVADGRVAAVRLLGSWEMGKPMHDESSPAGIVMIG